jgi:ABC-2 type transport system ATP-binding protein
MIVAKDLVKRFGPTVAVDRVSFEVGQGEVVGFLGPNGAGKTTTIRILTCYHTASSGSATVAGHDVWADSVGVRRNVGYLPENVPIYPDLRVREYLRYRAALKGVPRARRRAAVDAAMERCGVADVQRKLVGHVSRGYRQRVGLADALVASPPILILDEPTSGLDPNQRRRMKDLIVELGREHTVLFSSHILAEVADVSSRILIINHGVLVADGTIPELLQNAAGRRVMATARLDAAAAADCLRGIEGVGAPRIDLAEGDWTTFSAAVDRAVDPRDAVSARLRQRGVEIRELKLELPGLEHYFQAVTEGAPQAVEPEVVS